MWPAEEAEAADEEEKEAEWFIHFIDSFHWLRDSFTFWVRFWRIFSDFGGFGSVLEVFGRFVGQFWNILRGLVSIFDQFWNVLGGLFRF